MKHFLGKAILAVFLACASITVHAQSATPSVVYGRTTLQLNSAFVNSIAGLGATITDLNGNALQNSSITFLATGGAVNLATSAGEVEHAGGILVNAAGTVIRIQNVAIDNTNPFIPIVTALFIVNDQFMGRLPLFNVLPPPTFTLPFQTQQGVLVQNGLLLNLAPAAAATLNKIFGDGAVQGGTSIGIANLYIAFAPAN